MKKIGFISVSLVLAFVFGLSGCKKDLKTMDNSMVLDSLVLAETYYLNSDSTQPSCNLQVDFVYPKEYSYGKILSKVQILFIDKVLGGDYIAQTPENALQSFKDKYIENFKQFEEKFIKGDPQAEDEMKDETGFSYYMKLENSVPFNKNNIVSLLVKNNAYEGGAHGSSSIFGYVFDLTDGTIVAEKQIFTQNYEKSLSSIIVAKILKMNNLTDPAELVNKGYNSVENMVPNGNFIIDENGITYYFNETEIAAYVAGVTKIFIPYNELTPFLKKDSPIAKLAGL